MTSSRILLVTLLVCTGAPMAFGETYDYTVDRFELDGNVHGALDGTPDLVEDFGDGTMGPTFGGVGGTTSESGGVLHMQSPGANIAIPGITPVAFETSAVVQRSWLTGIQVGSGDLVARMVMPAQAIGANDAVNLLVQSIEGNGLYYAGVSIANFNAGVAALQQPPVTPGLVILAHQVVIDFGGNQQLILEDESIQGVPITGDIVLELHYDDVTQSLTPRYSLDGGATFAGSFSPLPVETDSGAASFYMAAVAHEGACPAGMGIKSLRLRKLGEPGYSGLTFSGYNTGGLYGPMRITVTDDGAGGATVFDVQLPDRLSNPTCDPRDGWTSGGGRVRYKNYSTALPPDCLPGSAKGLRRYEFRLNGARTTKIKVSKGTMPQVVGPLRIGLYSGTGPVNECDGRVGVATCLVKPGSARCPWP
jgi:hypothetical protein